MQMQMWVNEKNIVKKRDVCVFVFFLWMLFFFGKIEKNKEEFNILICSRSRIINLHVSRISNIR